MFISERTLPPTLNNSTPTKCAMKSAQDKCITNVTKKKDDKEEEE